ncbi:hypothetical protein J1605_005107 [Eschrichtius robustus]|uniref:Uncharacterized protein n=1 Tax=Eschrichtius robustus TaxID=9764 RepID=A0AB34HCS7_ESCRO|nr:hypothetical protein J1605_005107 [Eschrichtius robustus]
MRARGRRRRIPRDEDVKGSAAGLRLPGRGAGLHRQSCLVGGDSELWEALHCPTPLTSPLTPAPGSPLPPATLSPRSTTRRLRRSKKLAACNCNCTEGDTIAGALGVARGKVAMRVAPQRVGAGRLCSRRADSLRWNRPRSPPARSALPQPCFHPRSLPREAGLAVQNGRRLLAPTAISLTPWPRYLKVLVRGCPGIDFDNHH